MRVRPIGVLLMRDEKGLDEKILAVPLADPRFDGIQELAEIHGHWLAEIRNFFATYKMLEGKETRRGGVERRPGGPGGPAPVWAAAWNDRKPVRVRHGDRSQPRGIARRDEANISGNEVRRRNRTRFS